LGKALAVCGLAANPPLPQKQYFEKLKMGFKQPAFGWPMSASLSSPTITVQMWGRFCAFKPCVWESPDFV
jgi:hypothetical protein